ncbi:hypothetical protein TNCV_1179691 [Trichonephila clavipes]|nr:hypothetical protein TNCV_1179691 [Trichonephila clavipes]
MNNLIITLIPLCSSSGREPKRERRSLWDAWEDADQEKLHSEGFDLNGDPTYYPLYNIPISDPTAGPPRSQQGREEIIGHAS